MSLSVYRIDIDSVRPLLDAVKVASLQQQKIVAAGLSVGIIPPAIGACIVLTVGRFEQFLKDEGNRALDHYGKATPPINRIQLPLQFQLRMLSENLKTAMRATEHGVDIPKLTRVSALDAVANRIASGHIWGDDAIDTKSNPNPAVVKEVMALVGVADPWSKIEAAFQPLWVAAMATNSGFKAIPNAQDELKSWVDHRNAVAHTNSLPPFGPHQLSEMLEFFLLLGQSIDEVIQSSINHSIASLGSSAAPW